MICVCLQYAFIIASLNFMVVCIKSQNDFKNIYETYKQQWNPMKEVTGTELCPGVSVCFFHSS